MSPAERLFRKSETPSLFDCWLWTGAHVVSRSGKPYGTIRVARKLVLVHRLSYEIFVGPLYGECDHECQTTLCFNPAHLRDFTTSENRWNHHRNPVTQQYCTSYDYLSFEAFA